MNLKSNNIHQISNSMTLVDSFGRKIDYLRISITDHCNLKCHYCSPPFMERNYMKRSEILSYEELVKLIQIAVSAGINKIRITGGEPLIRSNVVEFCKMLSKIEGLDAIALTTNGVMLKKLAVPLYQAGVRKLNISLDSLKQERFEQITGRDLLSEVLQGITCAEKAGFEQIKINTVVMRNINADEIADLASLTYKKPYQVRFIELMPFQHSNNGNFERMFMPVREIIHLVPDIDKAHVCSTQGNYGPARLCVLPDAKGKIGFIAPMSWHFCRYCNRLRLTADGKIRSCLFSKDELDIKRPLRKGCSDEELLEIFRIAVVRKPRNHQFFENNIPWVVHHRDMYAIGG